MKVVESYIYSDGNLKARVDRIEPGFEGAGKSFLPYLWDLSAGRYNDKPGLNGTKLPLYHLNEVRAAIAAEQAVFIVEGEGKCDRLRAALRESGSLAAVTTIAGGANAPLGERHIVAFSGAKRVYVLADSDTPGDGAATERAQVLVRAYPDCDVRSIDLYPDRDDGSDVANWLNEGHTIAELLALCGRGESIGHFSERDNASCSNNANCSAEGKAPPQADRILKLVQDMGVELIRDEARTPYALVPYGNGKRGVYPLRSQSFNSLIAKEYYRNYERTLNPQAVNSAKLVLEGEAVHGDRCENVALRVAQSDGAIDIDLGDDDLRMAHITAHGWSIEPHGARLFRRCPGMLPLPEPLRGGDIAELRQFLRVDDNGFALVLCFLISALRAYGPYPILQIGGEHGSAKTTTARFLRALIDPNRVDVRGHCADTRDLLIAANNGHLLIFDNLSNISSRTSDDLCRLSTGGGFTTRQLYTDQEEVIFVVQKPMILTGISDLAGRADLSDRCLSVRQITISEHERQTERGLWEQFETARPRILGALFEAISLGLRRFQEIDSGRIARMRMADAYIWSLSTAPALGLSADALKRAWLNTRDEAHALTLESSPIYEPLRTVVEPVLESGGSWRGSAAELLARLDEVAPESARKRREWPTSARRLAAEIRQIAPALRSTGIHHEEPQRTSRKRLHLFTRPLPVNEAEPSVISVTSVIDPVNVQVFDDAGHGAERPHRHAEALCVIPEARCGARGDANDANDDVGAPLYADALTYGPLTEIEEEL